MLRTRYKLDIQATLAKVGALRLLVIVPPHFHCKPVLDEDVSALYSCNLVGNVDILLIDRHLPIAGSTSFFVNVLPPIFTG